MSKSAYCGISKTPKGKRIGTYDECKKANQIRRYGYELPPLIDTLEYYGLFDKIKKDEVSDLMKEQMKLKLLEFKAKKLISDIKKNTLILEKKPTKTVQKKYDDLLKQRDKLLKQLTKQIKIVRSLE